MRRGREHARDIADSVGAALEDELGQAGTTSGYSESLKNRSEFGGRRSRSRKADRREKRMAKKQFRGKVRK